MSITLIVIALLAIGNAFYAYRCVIGTRGFIDQYGTGDGSAFPIKLAGSFCAALAFMLVDCDPTVHNLLILPTLDVALVL